MTTPKKARLYLQEVVTRDGLQAEQVFVPTARKIELIDRLSRAGYAKVEVTSFTSPKAIPALADAEAVMAGIERVQGVEYTALIPNVRGARRAIDSRVDEFNLVMSTSETHNRSNLKMSREQSFAQLSEVIELAADAAVPVNVSLSTCFGCPMEGDVPQAEVMRWVEAFARQAVRGVTICDTTGMAHPAQVAQLCEVLVRDFPGLQHTLHFHNTRGMGAANALAAVQNGIVRFDASLGGLGGCPYAPGATGNVCTEELAHMFELMGYDTGVDVDRLLDAAALLRELVGHDVPSQLLKAGKVSRRHAAPVQA